MPQQFSNSNVPAEPSKPNHTLMLLSPSGVSLFICLLLGAAVPLWTALLSQYKSSALQQQLAQWQSARGGIPYDTALTNTSNDIAGYVSNILFWLILCMVTVIAVVSIFKAILDIRSVERELHYVNLNRTTMLREAATRLIVSLTAAGAIMVLTLASFKQITIWSVEQSSNLIQSMSLTSAALRMIAIALILAGLLHIYVILMRLALLRTRVINKS